MCWFLANSKVIQFSSVQSLSCVQLSATPCTAARQASLSITSSWSLLKLMSIKSVMPSNHLILCRPLLLPPSTFPSIGVFSNESFLRIRWAKYWSFGFNISASNEYSVIQIHLCICVYVDTYMCIHTHIYTCMYIYILFRFFSIVDYYKILNTVPCACMHAQSFQSCPTLCNPMSRSLPGSFVHGVFLARILEWVALPSSRGSSQPRDRTCISCVCCTADRFFTTEPLGLCHTVNPCCLSVSYAVACTC